MTDKCGIIKEKCIIAENEPDACCHTKRACCFLCFEDTCPIKEIYKDFILRYRSASLEHKHNKILEEVI